MAGQVALRVASEHPQRCPGVTKSPAPPCPSRFAAVVMPKLSAAFAKLWAPYCAPARAAFETQYAVKREAPDLDDSHQEQQQQGHHESQFHQALPAITLACAATPPPALCHQIVPRFPHVHLEGFDPFRWLGAIRLPPPSDGQGCSSKLRFGPRKSTKGTLERSHSRTRQRFPQPVLRVLFSSSSGRKRLFAYILQRTSLTAASCQRTRSVPPGLNPAAPVSAIPVPSCNFRRLALKNSLSRSICGLCVAYSLQATTRSFVPRCAEAVEKASSYTVDRRSVSVSMSVTEKPP